MHMALVSPLHQDTIHQTLTLSPKEQSRQAIETEFQTLKSTTVTSVSEIDTLRARVASLEASNRETVAIIDNKTTSISELSDELQRQHQKNVQLTREVTSLQRSTQVAEAAANSAKFREQSLHQELELARRNSSWFETELKTKNDEALKYRKEKAVRIAELQRLNEDANSTVESLTRSDQQLRSRLDAAQQKADEALSKVQQLQEAAARHEEAFRAELESAKRLVELKEQQTDTHRQRLKEVELRLEQVKDDSAAEVRRARQDLEQAREELQASDQRAQDLEAEADRLQAMVSTQGQPGSAPHTPGPNGSLLRPASPFGTPVSVRKSAITAAQAMEELYKTKGELAGERRRNQQLSRELDEIMAALEAKGPELEDLQDEAERLRTEILQMTRLADESFQERDLATKAARKADAANNKAQAEIQILSAQLRDLSTQVQVLVFNIQAQEKGLDQLTEEETLQFQRLQKGQVAEGSLDDMSDTHQFISERFVAFKDIQELQNKNAQLLRLTREMAEDMESEEKAAAKRQAIQDQKELEDLRAAIGTLQEESESTMNRMKSYMTERDMFRRMLQQKASVAEINSVLHQSTDGSHREVLASIEQNSAIDEADMTVALRELQNNFDSYRNEQSIDRQIMRDQIGKLSAERNSLQSEIAKLESQITLASERYELLQSNFVALQNENKELQRRSQTLSESAAKQDIRTQQAAEDLIETRALTESLRNENANLKAEKTFGKVSKTGSTRTTRPLWRRRHASAASSPRSKTSRTSATSPIPRRGGDCRPRSTIWRPSSALRSASFPRRLTSPRGCSFARSSRRNSRRSGLTISWPALVSTKRSSSRRGPPATISKPASMSSPSSSEAPKSGHSGSSHGRPRMHSQPPIRMPGTTRLLAHRNWRTRFPASGGTSSWQRANYILPRPRPNPSRTWPRLPRRTSIVSMRLKSSIASRWTPLLPPKK